MKKIITSFIIFLAFSTSCSNTFLDITDPSKISPSVYPANMADMEQITNAMYAMQHNSGLYGSELMAKCAFPIDHTCEMRHINTAVWNEMATNNYQPSNSIVTGLWNALYKMIGTTNTLLEEIDKFESSNTLKASEQARIEQMKGEAYFWRAWAHIFACGYFGEGYPCNGDGDKAGIPILTKVTTTYDEARKPRNTVNEVYAQAIADYKLALTLLPKSWSDVSDYPRPTYYAVQSFLGQAYLFQGNYANAMSVLKDVIANSGKSLLPFDEFREMFSATQTKFNNESILEINNYSSTLGTGSLHARYISLCYKNANGGTSGTGWDNIFFHDSNIDRFGDDPRLPVTALEPGTPVTIDGFETEIIKYKNIEAEYRGWAIRKYVEFGAIVNLPGSPYSGINFYLMRLADVYLMYAEACQATGNDSEACLYLNKVRRRAYQDEDHDIQATGTTLRDQIREERFRELCAEGVQHWQDVCRWKTLEQEIKTWYPKTRSGAPVYSARSLYLPIPQSEIENNPNMVQSAGY